MPAVKRAGVDAKPGAACVSVSRFSSKMLVMPSSQFCGFGAKSAGIIRRCIATQNLPVNQVMTGKATGAHGKASGKCGKANALSCRLVTLGFLQTSRKSLRETFGHRDCSTGKPGTNRFSHCCVAIQIFPASTLSAGYGARVGRKFFSPAC